MFFTEYKFQYLQNSIETLPKRRKRKFQEIEKSWVTISEVHIDESYFIKYKRKKDAYNKKES